MREQLRRAARRLGLRRGAPAPAEPPPGATVLIHVGKSGGRSLRDGIESAVRNKGVHVVHISKPVYREDLRYIVVARGPIARLRSAFRWRYELVVTGGRQRDRVAGEYDVLVKYGSLNALAEALYDERGNPDLDAQAEMRRIHHVREDLAFYLRDLLDRCRPDQIVAVLMQENLDDDIFRVFGYRNELRRHSNPPAEQGDGLSEAGLANLRRCFADDFAVLTTLYCWGKIERDVFVKAL